MSNLQKRRAMTPPRGGGSGSSSILRDVYAKHSTDLERLYDVEMEIAFQNRDLFYDDLLRRKHATMAKEQEERDRVREHQQRLAQIRGSSSNKRAVSAPRFGGGGMGAGGVAPAVSSASQRSHTPVRAAGGQATNTTNTPQQRMDFSRERTGESVAEDGHSQFPARIDMEGDSSRRSLLSSFLSGRSSTHRPKDAVTAEDKAQRAADLHRSLKEWSKTSNKRVDDAIDLKEAVMGDAEVPIYLPSATPEGRRSRSGSAHNNNTGENSEDPLDQYSNDYRAYQAQREDYQQKQHRRLSANVGGGRGPTPTAHLPRATTTHVHVDSLTAALHAYADPAVLPNNAQHYQHNKRNPPSAAAHYQSAEGTAPSMRDAMEDDEGDERDGDQEEGSSGFARAQHERMQQRLQQEAYRHALEEQIQMQREQRRREEEGEAPHLSNSPAARARRERASARTLDVDDDLTAKYLWAGGMSERERMNAMEQQHASAVGARSANTPPRVSQRRHLLANGEPVPRASPSPPSASKSPSRPAHALAEEHSSDRRQRTSSAYGAGIQVSSSPSAVNTTNHRGDTIAGAPSSTPQRGGGRGRASSPSLAAVAVASAAAASPLSPQKTKQDNRFSATRPAVRSAYASPLLAGPIQSLKRSIATAMSQHYKRCRAAVHELHILYRAQQLAGGVNVGEEVALPSVTDSEAAEEGLEVAEELIRVVSFWASSAENTAEPHNPHRHLDPRQNSEWFATIEQLISYATRAQIRLDLAPTTLNLTIVNAVEQKASAAAKEAVSYFVPLCFQLLALLSL